MNSNLIVITTLDSISSQKGKNYFDLWLKWEDRFSQIHVPVYILSLKSKEIEYVPTPKHIQIRFCPRKVFEYLNVYRTKTVFKKVYEVMDPAIFLLEGNQTIKKEFRTNDHSIGEVYLKALDIKKKKYVDNLRKKLTDKKEFASIKRR